MNVCILMARRLSSNLFKEWYLVKRLKSSFAMFYGQAIWRLPLPNIKRHSDPWPITVISHPIWLFHQLHDCDTELYLNQITSSFHGVIATGVACQQGTPIPFGTLVSVLTFWDLFFSKSWEHLPRTFRVFSRLFILNNLLYFLDFALNCP